MNCVSKAKACGLKWQHIAWKLWQTQLFIEAWMNLVDKKLKSICFKKFMIFLYLTILSVILNCVCVFVINFVNKKELWTDGKAIPNIL